MAQLPLGGRRSNHECLALLGSGGVRAPLCVLSGLLFGWGINLWSGSRSHLHHDLNVLQRGIVDDLRLADFGYYGFAAPGATPGIGLSPPQTHVYPMDPPGNAPTGYIHRTGALGHFGTGTYAQAVIPAIDHGLDYITAIGVPAIQTHAQELIGLLREGLTAKGYRLITPADARTPLLTALLPNAKERLTGPLARAQVRVSLHDHHLRIAPSVFTDMQDVERLLGALPRA